MATYGSGLRISALVSANRNSSGAIYTTPASTYAILNWALVTGGGATATIELGGVAFITAGAGVTDSSLMLGAALSGPGPIYLGPAQAVSTTITVSGTAYVNGPLFSN